MEASVQADVQEKTSSSELIVLDKLTPAAIFAPGGVDDVLDKIAREVRSQHTDISTKAGREAVASLAYKVARSKSALDKMGKELGEGHYKSWKAITAERARIEKELDALKDEVRKPLTEWEDAEKDRVAAHEEALATINALTVFMEYEPTAAEIGARIVALAQFEPTRNWQEFAAKAAEALQCALDVLNAMHKAAEKREAEAAELIRLRAEQVAREQKERDDRIAAEAAERARLEAETKARREAEEAAAKAEVERKRVEQEKAEAIARAEKAEADKKAAAAKAAQDAKEAAEAAERNRLAAIENERKRVADEAARVAAETAKREANHKHLAKINNEVLAAFVGKGVDSEVGKILITAIARGEIPHTKIAY
jgi:colicin import membrane protein